jgi:23S rRNA (adenine2503-C2)-methyltransferase
MGLGRNLSGWEIIQQVVLANRYLREEGRSVRNVVFMGMGEPFHNLGAVSQAIETLVATQAFSLAASRVTVSTVGVPEGMRWLGQHYPKVGLAISLHSARQEVRERLMPWGKKVTLAELRGVMEEVNQLQAQPLFIEYLLLAGENDRKEDIDALEKYLSGLRVHLNLIPYNPIQGGAFRGSDPEQVSAIATRLKQQGIEVTTRYSMGSDIAAACGQLVQERSKATAAKPTSLSPSEPKVRQQ